MNDDASHTISTDFEFVTKESTKEKNILLRKNIKAKDYMHLCEGILPNHFERIRA